MFSLQVSTRKTLTILNHIKRFIQSLSAFTSSNFDIINSCDLSFSFVMLLSLFVDFVSNKGHFIYLFKKYT